MNDRALSRDDVARLLRAMATPGSFYVTGAGASYGLVPTTAQLRAAIRDRYWSAGSFPASRALPSPMYDRVIGGVRAARVDAGEDPFTAANVAEAFLPTIRPAVLDMLVRMELVVPLRPVAPPQYAALNVARPGTIFSFNLDGLATAYCSRRHLVLEPHGRVERDLFESEAFAEMWQDLADFDLGVPNWTEKILLCSEPARLIDTRVYEEARALIGAAKFLVIVGYSFSRFGSGRDDEASLYFFQEQLKRWPRPVLVVDPFPDEIADLLNAGAGQGLAIPVSAEWDLLSSAIVTGVSSKGYETVHSRLANADEIVAIYRALLDR